MDNVTAPGGQTVSPLTHKITITQPVQDEDLYPALHFSIFALFYSLFLFFFFSFCLFDVCWCLIVIRYQETAKGDVNLQTHLKIKVFLNANEESFVYLFRTTYIKASSSMDSERYCLPHLISSHLISSHLISSHLISSHLISSHLISYIMI